MSSLPLNRVLLLIGAIAAGVCAAGARDAGAAVLREVCGREGSNNKTTDQYDLLCQTAYLNANSGIIMDNNSRVYSSVAIVCAYSCIGGKSSCSNGDGGKSGSCSTAMNVGHKSVDASDQSDSDLEAASKNGSNAWRLRSSKQEWKNGQPPLPPAQQGGVNSSKGSRGGSSGGSAAESSFAASDGGPSSPMPAACRKAGETGDVGSRIDCAVATDPSLPAFVKSQEFQQDFQKITGHSLQDVINKDADTLVDQYATGALHTAFKSLEGEVTLSEFMGRAGNLMGNLLGGFSEERRRDLAASIVPRQLQGMIPNLPGGSNRVSTALASAPSQPSQPGAREPASDHGRAALIEGELAPAPGELLSDGRELAGDAPRDFGYEPENNPAISIFERVSVRYKNVSVRLNAWAPLPGDARRLASP